MPSVFHRLSRLFWPDLCLVCRRRLASGERYVCASCADELPVTRFDSARHNEVCDRFAGKLPFVQAASAFHYEKESGLQTLFEAFKYRGNADLAYYLGAMAAYRLQGTGLFEGVEVLVPVPLHPDRLRHRGYNQSEWIARGMASVCGLPVEPDALVRRVFTSTQTRKGIWQRQENVKAIFALADDDEDAGDVSSCPGNTTGGGKLLAGKHVLLVDDVITTGATSEACAQAILEAPGARVSFFSLALA